MPPPELASDGDAAMIAALRLEAMSHIHPHGSVALALWARVADLALRQTPAEQARIEEWVRVNLGPREVSPAPDAFDDGGLPAESDDARDPPPRETPAE